MYKDFEDLRDNCPAEIKAEIAIDLMHGDPARLAEIWAITVDGAFRLFLTQRISDFWEQQVRTREGAEVPDDGFAIEIITDSYSDAEMGYSLYLELHAYCGTEAIGELAWSVFEDDDLETRFRHQMPGQVTELLAEHDDVSGLQVAVEVNEIEEL